MDVSLWPDFKEQVTLLLEEQEYVNTFPVNYVIKMIKGSIKDLSKFQKDDRFPQEDVAKWLKTFDIWLQDIMRQKCGQDVSIVLLLLFTFRNA